jgi:mannan polymerase II complex ANP1 subunit
MKREQLAQEQAEKERAEKAKKLKEAFADNIAQWEKDKAKLQQLAAEDKKKAEEAVAAAADNIAKEGEKTLEEKKAQGEGKS